MIDQDRLDRLYDMESLIQELREARKGCGGPLIAGGRPCGSRFGKCPLCRDKIENLQQLLCSEVPS